MNVSSYAYCSLFYNYSIFIVQYTLNIYQDIAFYTYLLFAELSLCSRFSNIIIILCNVKFMLCNYKHITTIIDLRDIP